MTPACTALIDTHNHEPFIEEAIVSVLQQDFPRSEIEVLVVDDGSTDRTPDIVRKFEPRVRLLRKSNGGQASAFNLGIAEAKGEFVAFLDGDDWWAREKLATIAGHLSAKPQVGVIGHGIYEFESATQKVVAVTPRAAGEIRLDTMAGGTLLRQMMCFFGTSRLAVRRDVLRRVLPIPSSLVIEADEFIATIATAHSAAVLIPQPLTFYRLHRDNLFQVRGADEVKTRRIQTVLAALASELRIRLESTEVAPDVTHAIVKPLEVDSTQLRLALNGGFPWETFQTERAKFRLAYESGSAGYWVFKAFALACSLVLPPRSFYRLREWYGRSRWRRMRSVLGEPSPRAAISIQGTEPGEMRKMGEATPTASAGRAEW